MHWSEWLHGFDFSIEYKPDKDNYLANLLTREGSNMATYKMMRTVYGCPQCLANYCIDSLINLVKRSECIHIILHHVINSISTEDPSRYFRDSPKFVISRFGRYHPKEGQTFICTFEAWLSYNDYCNLYRLIQHEGVMSFTCECGSIIHIHAFHDFVCSCIRYVPEFKNYKSRKQISILFFCVENMQGWISFECLC